MSLKSSQGFRRGEAVLVIRMTDHDVLERFRHIVGVGHVSSVKHHRTWQPHWKEAWQWVATRYADVLMIYLAFWPYLGERRRRKFEEAISVCAPPEPGSVFMKTHCKRGHPLAGPDADVRIRYYGGYRNRSCRACRSTKAQQLG